MSQIPAEIRVAFDKASRVILSELKQQAPVVKEGRNKGDLKNSIKIKPYFTSTQNLGFEITTDDYGQYLDMGTGTYRSKNRGKYTKNPGKGKGGIRPRFWLTISEGTKKRVGTMINESIIRYLKRALKK